MNKRNSQSRRQFLKATAAASVVPLVTGAPKGFAISMLNDRPGIGCIGLGGMGMGDAKGHAQFGDIRVVCDVDSRHAERARTDERIGNGKCDSCADYREVLDRDDVDVVSIATPDHWHVKIAIEALRAGKHVFCQKPLTLTLEENQLIRAACEAHPDLVFAIGTQQRSDQDRFLRAVNMVQQGLLGDITKVTCGINGGPSGGPFEVAQPPDELDWDRWLGPAPLVDYREKRCHYDFRWWYEYSGGKFTDWGAHHVDIALWALGLDAEGTGPSEIDGTDSQHPVPFENGFPTRDDSFNTATDFVVRCRFPDSETVLEINSRSDRGILFEGTRGRIFVGRSKIVGKPIEEGWDDGRFTEDDRVRLFKGKPPEGHKSNFYRCISEGGLPVSDVFSHVQTMKVCHLAAIAARLQRAINWEPETEQIVGDDEAAGFFAREKRAGYEISQI